jgi:Reverse transcriptase (RNA-dependent DNA polymerase)
MALLRWKRVYEETELYKSALRVYTKPLFQRRKALGVSTDGRNLYDLAGRGLRCFDAIHRSLERQTFQYRPAVALPYNFNGKRRTLYIPPWEERIVDLLLYRSLNRELHGWFSPNSYAYRDHTYGLDRCQSNIARVLRSGPGRCYLVKRDIRDYFGSVDHAILLAQLEKLVSRDDYLFDLLEQRVRFAYHDGQGERIAAVGIPFGTSVACLLANVYMTELDRRVERLPEVTYFRYADDVLLMSSNAETARSAAQCLDRGIAELRLRIKPTHHINLAVGSPPPCRHEDFVGAGHFRHLGLQFHANGGVVLSRDKCRKIQNLFRFAFRRCARRVRKLSSAQERAAALVRVAAQTIETGVRNVAIIDYYLKHVTDERQLVQLDRWLAEEVLSGVFGCHRKGNFGRISFAWLRAMGLPSLVHRRRLLLNRRIESAFFIWKKQGVRALQGTVARRARSSAPAFSPHPEAAAMRAGQPRRRRDWEYPPVGDGSCL